MAGRRIQVQKPPKPTRKKQHPLDTIAEFCYQFPQYTFEHARLLPIADIKRMLRAARRVNARRDLVMSRIVVSPHTKKGGGVKDVEEFIDKELYA